MPKNNIPSNNYIENGTVEAKIILYMIFFLIYAYFWWTNNFWQTFGGLFEGELGVGSFSSGVFYLHILNVPCI